MCNNYSRAIIFIKFAGRHFSFCSASSLQGRIKSRYVKSLATTIRAICSVIPRQRRYANVSRQNVTSLQQPPKAKQKMRKSADNVTHQSQKTCTLMYNKLRQFLIYDPENCSTIACKPTKHKLLTGCHACYVASANHSQLILHSC